MRAGGPPFLAIVRPDTNLRPDTELDFEEEVATTAAPVESVREAALSTDVVPPFRTDMKLTRAEGGYLVQLSSGESFKLNQFEVSIIRMLDGKRTVSELVANCRRLEIPINDESLRQFILEL